MENKELIELLYLVMVLVVVLCALFVGHEVGYRQGYTYVLESDRLFCQEPRREICIQHLRLSRIAKLC